MTRTIEPGQFFEHFYVIAQLGEGGMSQVFLGYDLLETRLVAMKFLLGLHAQSPKAIARLRREGEIYRSLDHPAILDVLELASAPGVSLYLVLEFLRGRPLDEVMEGRSDPMTVPQSIRVLEDVGSALNLAHRNQVIHRDVKPQNIMVGPDGRFTIFDFGIARAQDDLITTQMGSIMGTLAYSAPEQRVGGEADHRADIFSLGAILYEMLTRRRVIEIGSYREMVQAETAFLPDPSELNPAVPPVVDGIIRKMIADSPDERYGELREILIELGLMRMNLSEEERTALFGTSAEQRMDEVQRAFREGNLESAEEQIMELTQRPPPSIGAELFHLRSQIEVQLGHSARSIESLEMAMQYDPSNLEILLDLGLALLRAGRFERVRELFHGVPSWLRGNLLVRSMVDLLRALPETPPEVMGLFGRHGISRRFQEEVRAIHS